MRLSEKDKDRIMEILGENIIIAIQRDGEDIWTCNGGETNISKKLKIEAYIKDYNLEDIIKKLLALFISELLQEMEK